MDDTDAQASNVWPELEALALPAQKHRRLLPERRSSIILRLCHLAPLSVKELSVLLNRSEAYIGDAIRPLVNNGSLTFLYPDQPRHPKQKYKSSQEAVDETLVPPADEPPSNQAVEDAPSDQSPQTPPTQAGRMAAKSAAPALPGQPAAIPPAPADETAAAVLPSSFPNQVTNVVVAIVLGVILATLSLPGWPIYALLAALALSLSHIVAHSSQYEKFQALQGSPRKRRLAFILLKSSVSLIEILLVYVVTSAIAN